jgi:hypothetical protein
MPYVIKDRVAQEYFVRHPSSSGWYHPNLNHARIYQNWEIAEAIIFDEGHHVTHPGDRWLIVVKVRIEEDYP